MTDPRPLLDVRWLALCLTLLAAWAGVSVLGVRLGAVAVPGDALAAILLAGGHPADPAAAGWAAIVWEVRLPRVLLGGLAGLALAVAGAAWQGVLRNPLADPYLVGASAGAATSASTSTSTARASPSGASSPLTSSSATPSSLASPPTTDPPNWKSSHP